MKEIFLLLLVFFSLNSFSQEEFKLIGESKKNGEKCYVKIENRQPNKCSVWLKIEISKTRKNKKGKPYFTYDGYAMTYMVFYCSEKVYDTEDYLVYDKNGTLMQSGNRQSYHERVVPESMVEGIYNYVCTSDNSN